MVLQVTDRYSNVNDQIANAARAINRSLPRRRIFEYIYSGKKKIKTAGEIAKALKLSEKRVLEEAAKLCGSSGIVEKDKTYGKMGYKKNDFIHHHKAKILSLAQDRKKLNRFPTKVNTATNIIRVTLHKSFIKVQHITIDDIDSFKLIRKIKNQNLQRVPINETAFKHGVKKIIGEKGKFQDWGGEKNDLYTSRLIYKGKRYAAAFAFKGKGTKIKRLTPKYMGKHGDQIQRLFQTPADIFLIQYWKEIDESIVQQMHSFATALSVSQGRKIYFCIIDGLDTARLLTAYKSSF